MTNDARTAADTGLPDDSTVDFDGIGIRLLRVHSLLGLDLHEATAIIKKTGDERGTALVDFCLCQEVSLDWLMRGRGGPLMPVDGEDGTTGLARIATDPDVPDFDIDWKAIAVRLAKVEIILELDSSESLGVLAAHDADAAIVDFCKRNGVSLDWLVLGEGTPAAARGRMSEGPGE